MYTVNTLCNKVGYLVYSVGDPCITESCFIMLILFKHTHKLFRQLHTAQLHHTLYLTLICHRHYTCFNGNFYPCDTCFFVKIIEIAVIKEKL